MLTTVDFATHESQRRELLVRLEHEQRHVRTVRTRRRTRSLASYVERASSPRRQRSASSG